MVRAAAYLPGVMASRVRTRGGWTRAGRSGSLQPPGLAAWLAGLEAADPGLQRVAEDIAFLVGRGWHPRAAAAAVLRVVVDDLPAPRR
jgi:hypothetical protein